MFFFWSFSRMRPFRVRPTATRTGLTESTVVVPEERAVSYL